MRTAIIPVGGTGRRMLPLTATIPKPLLPVNMKAAVHYIVNECVDSGVERIGLVTKYRAQDIIDYFTENKFPEFDDVDIEFIPQGDGWGMMDATSNTFSRLRTFSLWHSEALCDASCQHTWIEMLRG